MFTVSAYVWPANVSLSSVCFKSAEKSIINIFNGNIKGLIINERFQNKTASVIN